MKIKQNTILFIQTQNQKKLSMKVHWWCVWLIYPKIISKLQKSLGKVSIWIIDSVIDCNTIILKYNPLAGSIYVKLPKELYHPRKWLINIQNIDDNESFKWNLVRCLNTADCNPGRTYKSW